MRANYTRASLDQSLKKDNQKCGVNQTSIEIEKIADIRPIRYTMGQLYSNRGKYGWRIATVFG